jgi:hypothetical protein
LLDELFVFVELQLVVVFEILPIQSLHRGFVLIQNCPLGFIELPHLWVFEIVFNVLNMLVEVKLVAKLLEKGYLIVSRSEILMIDNMVLLTGQEIMNYEGSHDKGNR